jgi:hypothetical protein
VINVSDPEQPSEIGAYQTEGFANDINVHNDLAYVTDGDLQIIDVSDPTNPQRVGVYNTRYANSVTVSEDLAYVTGYDNGLRIVDISDPSHPQEIGHFGEASPLMNLVDVCVNNDRAYIVDASWGLTVVDVSDPRNPERVCSYEIQGGTYSIAIYNDLVYIANSSNGFLILDVSNLDSIVQVGFYDTPGLTKEITLYNGLIYVADGTNLGIYRYTNQGIIKENMIKSPSGFLLNPAYPNPFNSMTNIRYQLPEASKVSIQIFDIQGREIVTLINDNVKAGYYNVIWNAPDNPAGVYLLRIEAGSYRATRKVVLVK